VKMGERAAGKRAVQYSQALAKFQIPIELRVLSLSLDLGLNLAKQLASFGSGFPFKRFGFEGTTFSRRRQWPTPPNNPPNSRYQTIEARLAN
jgi:hypothetical protein